MERKSPPAMDHLISRDAHCLGDIAFFFPTFRSLDFHTKDTLGDHTVARTAEPCSPTDGKLVWTMSMIWKPGPENGAVLQYVCLFGPGVSRLRKRALTGALGKSGVWE